MTSATERLRALLTERGVEWRRTPHYSSESIDNETVFRGEGIEWLASDHLNGRLGLRALKYEVTPEQAVEATLGRGTCRMERVDDELEAENAKLRELAVLNWEWAHSCCGNNCKMQTDGCGYQIDRECNYEREIYDRMRELGMSAG